MSILGDKLASDVSNLYPKVNYLFNGRVDSLAFSFTFEQIILGESSGFGDPIDISSKP